MPKGLFPQFSTYSRVYHYLVRLLWDLTINT